MNSWVRGSGVERGKRITQIRNVARFRKDDRKVISKGEGKMAEEGKERGERDTICGKGVKTSSSGTSREVKRERNSEIRKR